MSDLYEGPIELAWENDAPAGTDEIVLADIRRSLWGMDHPSHLVFHTVFLGDIDTGPIVHVYGVESSDFFHCRYVENSEWVEWEVE